MNKRLFKLWVAVAAVACGNSAPSGDSGGGVASTDTSHTGTTVPTTGPYEATWAGVEELFGDHCDVCHPATTGIDLRDVIPRDVQDGTGIYVVSGDRGASFLWQVLAEDTLLPMPSTGQLAVEKVKHVGEWIDAGAPIP